MALLNEAQILESYKIPKQNRRNMTNAEFIAKKDLANDKSIIIKKANKGSAVVVQNHSDYINEGLRQLSDKNFYLETKTDLTAKHNALVQTEVKRLISTKEISEKTGQYLFIENARTSKLYLLPKIHKNVNPPPRQTNCFGQWMPHWKSFTICRPLYPTNRPKTPGICQRQWTFYQYHKGP